MSIDIDRVANTRARERLSSIFCTHINTRGPLRRVSLLSNTDGTLHIVFFLLLQDLQPQKRKVRFSNIPMKNELILIFKRNL